MISTVWKNIQQLWNDIRHDAGALHELKQVIFGIIIVMGVTYGYYTLYVETKEKVNKQRSSRVSQLTASLGGKQLEEFTAAQLEKLTITERKLSENISFLEFKESILRGEYSGNSTNGSFTNVIFTLLPFSPVDIENGFVQMNVLDTRAYEFYNIDPVNVQGDINYADFLYYLKYLEDRPEVGMIGGVRLKLELEKSFVAPGKIHFDIVLGSVKLHNVR